MIPLLWLSRLILLTTCAGPSLGGLFELDQGIWNTRVPEDEALAFFSKLNGNNEMAGDPRSGVASASAKHTDVNTKPSALKDATRAHTREADKSVDDVIKGIKDITDGLTLSTLSDGVLSGSDWTSSGASEEEGKMVITADFGRLKSTTLPGGLLTFAKSGDTDPLVVKFHTSDPSFKATEIIMEGETYFTNKPSIKIATSIEKNEGSEEFTITKFDIVGKATEKLDIVGSAADVLSRFVDLGMTQTVINTMKEELETFSGFGAFNKESMQLVIVLDEQSSVSSTLKAKSTSFLIAQDGENTGRKLSVFVTYENFIEKVTTLFSATELFTNNFLLKHLEGEACLFLVTSDIEYLDPIKSDERMTKCFPNQEEDRAQEVFKSTEAGLHASVKVDFKEVLLQGCWSERSDTPSELTGDDPLDITIYATITKSGIGCSMLSNVTLPTKLISACFSGLIRQAPDYLTDGQITLNHLSREIIEEEEEEDQEGANKGTATKKTHWKINFLISPAKEYSTLPGTSISLNNFEIDAEGDQGYMDSWNIEANLAVTVRTSEMEFSLKKEGTEYVLGATSSKILLGDLLGALSVTNVGDGDSESIFDTLGVKDFSLAITLGSEEHEFVINGKPIIFDYDKLEVSAIVKKPNETTVTDTSSEEKPAEGGGKSLTYYIGIYMNGADFSSIAKNLFNMDVNLQWLSGLKAIAVFTNDVGNVVLGDKASEEAVKARYTKKHTKTVKKSALVPTGDKKVERSNLQQTLSRRALTRETREDEEVTDEVTPTALTFDELHADLDGVTIEHAITLGMIWTLPAVEEECHENPLCVWMVKNLGTGTTASIFGYFGAGTFALKANISASIVIIDDEEEKLTFTGLQLELEVGTELPQVQLSATMTYSNTHIGATGDNILTFTGAITATPISLSLSFTMEGFIYPEFGGTTYIGIGDITLGGGYSGGVPSFTFGVAIKLGEDTKENSDAIEIRGSFGVSPSQPKENWIYGSISSLNIDAVCKAFKLECDTIPERVKTSGFPNGITVSYTSTVREVPGVGEIPEGLHVKGTINIFGLECSCEFNMDTEGLSLQLEMSPIDWANGMIQVLKNEEDTENGPSASVRFSKSTPEDFAFSIDGYGNILEIFKTGVSISIDSESFLLDVTGFLIPAILEANLHIEAQYGTGDADGALFQVTASVMIKFGETLKEKIKEFMEYLQRKVEAAFKKATDALNAATLRVDNAKKNLDESNKKIENWKKGLAAKKKKLEEESKPVVCTCNKVCFPFLDWNPKCWKAWGYDVGCPYLNKCFKMVTDIICEAACALMKIVSAVVKWAKQAILSIGILIATGVQGLLTLAEGILEMARSVLKVAEHVVNAFHSTIAAALIKAKDVFDDLLKQFVLHELTLSATLSADFTACLGYVYNLTFFGSEQVGEGEVCLDLKSFTSALIGGITEGCEETKGSTKTPEKLQEINSEEEDLEKAKVEFDKENATASTKIKEETSQTFDEPGDEDIKKYQAMARSLENVPRQHYVPTEEEMEMTELANRNMPGYDVRGDAMVRSFVDESPWQLPDHHTPVGHNGTVRHDETETGQRRTLDFDADLTPCKRMKRALQGYSQVTDGILKYSEAVQKSKDAMHRSRIADNDKLNHFQSLVQDAELKHNITGQERDDAYFVYNNLAYQHEELARKSEIALHVEDTNALPIIRRHINALLRKEKGTNFLKFTDIMHLNAVEGYKRSQIPHPDDAQGEKMLGNIKQDLQAIVTDESSALTPMTPRLQNVRKNIIAMSEYTKQCPDN